MKTHSGTKPSLTAGNYGVALVMVLFALFLLSAILVSFFATVTTDSKSSALYHEEGRVKRLSDTAINTVIAQIRAATLANETETWASQPGAIRRYNTSGQFVAGYKLYTSGTMVETGSELAMTSADLPPYDWKTLPGLYTDLNSPTRTASGSLAFPIISGNGIKTCVVGGSSVLTYDADGNGEPDIAGFSIDPNQTQFSPTLAISGSNNPVAMPVMWHYLLQDGRIVVPHCSGATIAVTGASKANPIIGRIAFWTDDETCKVNVNTASYENTAATTGTTDGDPFSAYHAYHAPPVCEGSAEHNLARYQPARNEAQRFPGHPATTNLGVIFPKLTASELFQLAPRIAEGGSMGGTVKASGAVTYDNDRLYPTLGELLYAPTLSGSSRDPNPNAGSSALDSDTVERARFFATTRSRAPELNLFGKPRVAIWPIPLKTGTTYRTAFDELIAFCSSSLSVSGTARYYLQRNDPTSPTADQQLSGNLALFGDAANQSYLQYVSSRPVPGFGGDFSSKYGSDRDQILTEIEDYIRSSNLNDPLLSTNSQYTKGAGATTTDANVPVSHGQVTPLYNAANDTMGMGRFATIASAAIHFICTGTAGSTQRSVAAMLHLERFVPTFGPGAVTPEMTVQVTGLETFSLITSSTTNLGFPSSGTIAVKNSGRAPWGGFNGSKYFNYTVNPYPFIGTPVAMTFSGANPVATFSGGTIEVTVSSGNGSSAKLVQTISINFPQAVIPLPALVTETYTKNSQNIAPELFWSFATRQNFNSASAPFMHENDTVRGVSVVHGDYRLVAARKTVGSEFYGTCRDYNDQTKPYSSRFFMGGVTSTEVPAVPPSIAPNYGGTLVTSGSYSIEVRPRIPSKVEFDALSASINRPWTYGDWDNGTGESPDGPFVNRPDEGSSTEYNANSSVDPYYWQYDKGNTAISGLQASPNRIMPSPGVFGSLPTGVKSQNAWQTLLFRPYYPADAAGGATHPGASNPPDHLLMDLFWMPVVQPYAISENFSTAGKINMNYQIVPFTNIKRDSALRAVFASERVIGIPLARISDYKSDSNKQTPYRYPIDADQTLRQFELKFAGNQIFRSATEICTLDLIPRVSPAIGVTGIGNNLGSFWLVNGLTGENSKERPYTNIYPRLTTKSNSYVVHYRVQSLKKTYATDPGVFVDPESGVSGVKDVIGSEIRGSAVIERYLDPNDTLPDYTTDPAATSMESHYRYRAIAGREFLH